MRITDTLDQLLRTLLASSTSAPEALAQTASPSEGTAAATGDVSGSNATSTSTGETETSPEAPAVRNGAPSADPGSVTPIEAAAARPSGHTDLERIEITTGVAESLGLGFHLGSAVDRIAVAALEGSEGGLALREAAWLIKRYVELLEHGPLGADIHASALHLDETDALISDLRQIADRLDSELALEPATPQPELERAEIILFESALVPEPQPESEPEPEPDLELEPEPEPEPELELEPEPETERELETATPLEPTPDEPALETAAQIIPFEPAPETEESQLPPAGQVVTPEPTSDQEESQPEPEPLHVVSFERAPEPEPAPVQIVAFGPVPKPEPEPLWVAPFGPIPKPEPEPEPEPDPEPEPLQIVPFGPPMGHSEPEPERVETVPFGPAPERSEPEATPAPAQTMHFEPAPELPTAELRPRPPLPFVQATEFSTAAENGGGRSVDRGLTPDELPPLRHEIFITAVRAVIALAVVTLLVLVLTLIAQWH